MAFQTIRFGKVQNNKDCFQNFVMKWAPLPKNLFYIQRCGGQSELSCVFELQEQLEAYCTEQGNQKAAKFHDILWLVKLAYLASIFDCVNEVNLSLQGKRGVIFRATSKIDALKLKILIRKNNV